MDLQADEAKCYDKVLLQQKFVWNVRLFGWSHSILHFPDFYASI